MSLLAGAVAIAAVEVSETSSAQYSTTVSVYIVAIIAVIAAAVWASFVVHRRHSVSASSAALHGLAELNDEYQSSVSSRPSIRMAFNATVNSKAKLDRFDLQAHISSCVLEQEQWFGQEIASRLAAVAAFAAYEQETKALAHQQLGKSNHPRVPVERFARIEKSLFERRKLRYPTPTADVVATVSYTSPQGRNSYLRRLDWNFEQLRSGLAVALETRARQSTVQAQRQRERNMMTHALRMEILRRDGFRCKLCGASATDGVALHVDHVTPVSRGGQTTRQNLQTLCEPCNLGKSNRFVG
jgi:hypothetical protein